MWIQTDRDNRRLPQKRRLVEISPSNCGHLSGCCLSARPRRGYFRLLHP